MIKSIFKAEISLWQRSRRRLLPARPCDWSCCHRLGLMALLLILHSSISSICICSCCDRLRLIILLSIPYPSISSTLSHIGIDYRYFIPAFLVFVFGYAVTGTSCQEIVSVPIYFYVSFLFFAILFSHPYFFMHWLPLINFF